MRNIFKHQWMDRGRVGKYLREHKDENGETIAEGREYVRAVFNGFQKSEAWEIMKLALLDFRDHVNDKQVRASLAGKYNEGYAFYLARLAAELSFPNWVVNFVEDLKGIEEQAEKAGISKSIVERYI